VLKEEKKTRREMITWASLGITVLRFSDRDVLGQLDVVMEKIWSRL